MIPTEEEVARLERYVEASRELVDLKDELAECLEIVKELKDYPLPTQSQIQATAQHLEDLQAVADLVDA